MLKFYKIILTIIFTLGLGWIFSQTALSKEPVNLYLFYSRTCLHCHEEREFLNKMFDEYGAQLKIQEFEVFEHRDLLKAAGDIYDYHISGVPVTIIGDHIISGFLNEQTTGREIKRYIDQCINLGCSDKLGEYIESQKHPDQNHQVDSNGEMPEFVNLPFIGQVQTKSVSLPILTVLIAAVDGFNPCAMWVLMFLISLLLGMQNRRRMWLMGATFIVASGLVYFLFLAAWLNILIFLGFIIIVRIIIGLAALAMGGYNLREWWINRPGCKVTQSESRKKIFEKLKAITQKKSLLLALSGIILLAFAVNLVELICSAGLPAIFTQVLTLTEMAHWQYYLYLLLYIFIFMLDDMLIFMIAMITLKSVGLSGKYSRFSHLIGGVIMLILGLLLVFKPEWLMFG